MNAEDPKSKRGSDAGLRRPQENPKEEDQDDEGEECYPLFWPVQRTTIRDANASNGTSDPHPFVIQVEEANVRSLVGPPVKRTFLEDAIQHPQNTQEVDASQVQDTGQAPIGPEKREEMKEKPAAKPFQFFSFCRKDRKKKLNGSGGPAPPPPTPKFGTMSPSSDLGENPVFSLTGLSLFRPSSKTKLKRNGELPHLEPLVNAPTIPSFHNQDEPPPQQELKDLSSIYDILNTRDKGVGDFTSVNFEIESYNINEDDLSLSRSLNHEQILPVFGSRPDMVDGWSSAGDKKRVRAITAGIRPVLSFPPGERVSPLPETPPLEQDELESWMAALPPDLQRVPLNHLFIPGSHDSFSFSLSADEEIGPDAPDIVANLDSCCCCLARPAILRWSVTQKASVGDQLKHGIRYFDIRVAVRDTRFFFVHGLFGDDLEPLLSEIHHFLVKHPGEVVFLDFQHFHGLSERDHAALITLLKATFADRLCPFFKQLAHLTLAYLSRFKYQVLVFYRHKQTMQAVTWLWSTASIPNPWPNTTSITNMIAFLEDKLKERDPHAFFVTQCILTPSGKYLLTHVTGTLERDMAVPCNKVVGTWVSHLPQGPKGPNIVMTDFVEQDNWAVPRAVVNRNSTSLMPSTPLQRY